MVKKSKKPQKVTIVSGKKRTMRVARPLAKATIGKGYPKALKLTHRYSHVFEWDLSNTEIDTIAYYTFSVNSLDQPNITELSTNRPIYFLENAALYNYYEVIGSRISVRAIPLPQRAENTNGSIGLVNPACIGLLLRDKPENPSSDFQLDALNSQPSAFYKFTSTTNTKPITLIKKWSQKRNFPGQRGDDDLIGTPLATSEEGDILGPDKMQFFTLYGRKMETSGVQDTRFYVEVEIDYITQWTELLTTQTNSTA